MHCEALDKILTDWFIRHLYTRDECDNLVNAHRSSCIICQENIKQEAEWEIRENAQRDAQLEAIREREAAEVSHKTSSET